jgi:hypothetical protein
MPTLSRLKKPFTHRNVALIFLTMTLFAQMAYAAKGTVVYKNSRCDYYIVETVKGFALLEWYGGNDPDLGDVIVGDFESYGMKTLHNITNDRETKAWVEDYWLSKDKALEKFHEKCE